MIVEERVYTLVPGGVPEYLRLYQEFGMEIQKPILGHMVGYFHTEIGTLNQIVHMWAYDSLDERTRRRTRPLILSQESKILIPAPFSPNP